MSWAKFPDSNSVLEKSASGIVVEDGHAATMVRSPVADAVLRDCMLTPADPVLRFGS